MARLPAAATPARGGLGSGYHSAAGALGELPFRRRSGRAGGERSKPAEAYVATDATLGWLLALPLSWVLVAAPLRLL